MDVEADDEKWLLFGLLWYLCQTYDASWYCKAAQKTVRQCCAHLGIRYHRSGYAIAGEMKKALVLEAVRAVKS